MKTRSVGRLLAARCCSPSSLVIVLGVVGWSHRCLLDRATIAMDGDIVALSDLARRRSRCCWSRRRSSRRCWR